MAETSSANAPASVQHPEAAYQAFHQYRWDLDTDFLGGLVLALGGLESMSQTASQADIVMHSRIFYYGRISGTIIPYAGYRQWLKEGYQTGPNARVWKARVWEWDLLESLCNHRDRFTTAHFSEVARMREEMAAERTRWMRELLRGGAPQGRSIRGMVNRPSNDDQGPPAPAWMAAAPKGELYVDRRAAANDDDGSSPAYPERFAQIIRAVQTGEPVEGIVEIPDMVARNPTTAPIGKMARPLKPWEKAQPAAGNAPDGGEHGLEAHLDQSFPAQEESAKGST